MDFAEVERRFYELKGRLAAGLLTPAAFEAAARELTLRDAGGRLWTIGAQTGKWYYASGGAWVEALPPQGAASSQSGPAGRPSPGTMVQPVAPVPVASEAGPPQAAAGSGRSALPWLAAGCLGAVALVLAGALALALFFPGSPWRGLAAGWGAPPGTPVVQRTPDAPTQVVAASPVPETAPPTVTPVVIVVTATPAPATPTPTAPPVATTMATSTATALPPSATATRPPAPTATATATVTMAPVAPSPLNVTLSNPHYERWGRPTDSTGCLNYNNGSPVRRFTIQIIVKNNTSTAISDWKSPFYYSNSGASLARCYYPFNQSETTLPAVPANSANTVTFVSFTDEGTWVSRVEFVYRDRTWRWILDFNGQVISGP